MLVCKCKNVDYFDTKEAVRKIGMDIEDIKSETGAGTGCRMCLNEECDKTGMTVSESIEKTLDELNFEQT